MFLEVISVSPPLLPARRATLYVQNQFRIKCKLLYVLYVYIIINYLIFYVKLFDELNSTKKGCLTEDLVVVKVDKY